jgi:tetratricopeptide (TPR) repeat protein
MPFCWTCSTSSDISCFTCPNCAHLRLEQRQLQAEHIAVGVSALHTLVSYAHLQAGWTQVQVSKEQVQVSKQELQVNKQQLLALGDILTSLDVLGKETRQLSSILQWGLSEIAWRLEQNQNALKSIDQTLRTPAQTQANEWREMGESLLERGVVGEAERFYRKSLDQNPLDYRTYVGIANVLIRQNQYGEADSVLEAALPHAPPATDARIADYRSLALRMRGHIKVCEGKTEAAIPFFEKATLLSPRYDDAWYELAVCEAQCQHWDKTADALRAAIENNPVCWELARLDRRFRDYKPQMIDLLRQTRRNYLMEQREMRTIISRNLASVEEEIKRFSERLDAVMPLDDSNRQLKPLGRLKSVQDAFQKTVDGFWELRIKSRNALKEIDDENFLKAVGAVETLKKLCLENECDDVRRQLVSCERELSRL